MAQTMSKENPEYQVWFADSDCSNHMYGCKEWFYGLDETFRTTVKLGDNSRMHVVGKGNIKLKIGGKIHEISNVYYIPKLKNHLLSVGQLQERNVFEDNKCRVYHKLKGLIMQSFMSSNRMFSIHASLVLPGCLKMTGEEITQLWHCRYAHLSLKGLKTLANNETVKGLPYITETNPICSDYLKVKQHRNPFPQQTTWRASKKLQLVPADICGPLKPTSNSGKRYLITFIDDMTRKT